MLGLVLVKSPDEVTQERERSAGEQVKSAPDLPALVSFFKAQWEIARRRKQTVELEMLAAQQARAGEYTASEIEAIRKVGGTDAYRNLCDVKCRTGAAWIRDIVFQPGDDPFSVEPTPVPDLPDDVSQRVRERVQSQVVNQAVIAEMQSGQQVDIGALRQHIEQSVSEAMDELGGQLYAEANQRSGKMMETIRDQLTEAKFEKSAARFIDDLVTYHAGILKGPVIRMRQELSWQPGDAGSVASSKEAAAPEVDRVHPLDFYPVNPYDIEFAGVYERHRWHPGMLQRLIGVDGYREEAIREVLSEYRSGSLQQWLWTDNERNQTNGLNDDPDTIDCLECWESVQGHMLTEWGIEAEDPEHYYQIHAFLIGNRLIRVVLNPHPLGKRPYFPASYVAGDTIWGRSVHRLIKDTIKAASAVYRAAINNCALAWGPMTEVNKDRLAPGESGAIHPLKMFMTTDDMVVGTPAVRITDIPYKGHMMLQALEEIEKRADDESGIPAYAHGGEDIGGAGKTSSGLSMLLGMATKTIKDVVRNVDQAIEGLIEGFYVWNMEFNPDQSIKGDCKVKAKASTALIIKEQMAVRLREFLAQTANQIDMQITGVEGRGYALKEAAKGLNLEADKLVPTMPVQNNIPLPTSEVKKIVEPGTALDAAGQPAGGAESRLPEAISAA